MIGLVAGGVSLSLAAAAALHAYSPKSQLYGRTFIGTPGRGKKLALTFDDGPNPTCTPALLEVLARHHVRATFFMIGQWVMTEPALAREVPAAGHEVGNHTYTHPNLFMLPRGRVRDELRKCQAALEGAGLNNRFNLFRPPYGARRRATLKTATSMGLVSVNWSITGYDWMQTTAARVQQHVNRQLRGGDVLLFHDGGHLELGADRTHTVRAVDELVPRLRDEGFEFVTVGDWITSSDVAGGNR